MTMFGIQNGIILIAVSICFYQANTLTINVTPRSVIQPARTSVSVDCTATGTPKPTISWYLEGLPVQNDTQMVVFTNGTLHIPVLRRKLAGSYKCEANSQDLKNAYMAVKIEVATLSKLSPIEDIVEIVGNKINITCLQPIGNPMPTVTWLIGENQPLPADTRFQPNGWSLVIEELKFEDSNNYTCVASNIARNRTATMQLTATIPGDNVVTPKSLIVVENKTASFSCKSTANPPLPIVWKHSRQEGGTPRVVAVEDLSNRDNYVVSDDGTLLIKKAGMEDNGTFNCVSVIKTSFYKQTADLTVHELVKVDAFISKKQHFNYDDRATPQKVTCKFRGYGKITVRWSKEGLPKLPDRMKSQGNQLIIDKIDFKDQGIYVCEAIGPYNTATGRIMVDVLVYPTFTLIPRNASASTQDPVWIDCTGSGRPKPTISWTRGNNMQKIITNTTRHIIFHNGTLHILKAEEEDTGQYQCILSNGPTIERSSLYLDVTARLVQPGKGGSQPQMGRTIGIAVGCAGAYIVIVVGLMIYCRSRRSRMMREQTLISAPIDDGHNDPLLNNPDHPFDPAAFLFPREDLEEIETLGHGKIGRIYTAKACGITDGAMKAFVAVKELVAKNSGHREDFESEISMLATLRHDCVVKLLGICTESYPLLMITEYSEKGDLKHFLLASKEERNGVNGSHPVQHHLTSANRRNICHHIAAGMEYLASNRLIHRDLAARNCVAFSNMEVKVAFLSLCEDRHKSDYYTWNGVSLPLRWLSPEVIQDDQYSEKSDVWAFGVVMWEVYSCGAQPYHDCSNDSIVKYIESDLRLPLPNGCDEAIWRMMQSCWASNPVARPMFSEIMSALNEMPLDSNV